MEFVKGRRINKTNSIMAETFSSFGISSIPDRKVISNAKEREIAKSSPFSKPAPKNIADQLYEVIRKANSGSNYYIQNVCINKDGAVIYLYTKESLQYMKNACVTSRKMSIIVVDKTYNLCGFYVTVTTFEFARVLKRKTRNHPILIGPIMLHFKSDLNAYLGFFSDLRKILEIYRLNSGERVFLGSDEEKAISTAINQAISEAIH